jgi:hypothetical protein
MSFDAAGHPGIHVLFACLARSVVFCACLVVCTRSCLVTHTGVWAKSNSFRTPPLYPIHGPLVARSHVIVPPCFQQPLRFIQTSALHLYVPYCWSDGGAKTLRVVGSDVVEPMLDPGGAIVRCWGACWWWSNSVLLPLGCFAALLPDR